MHKLTNFQLIKKKIVQRVINAFKEKNLSTLGDLIQYPLQREYPLKDVKDKNEFTKRFDEFFDSEVLAKISNSSTTDWTEVGWRGIMFDNGKLWLDEKGMIVSIHFETVKEKQLLDQAIKTDKLSLPKSLQNFEKPVYVISTKNYKIRIDQVKDGKYRYVAWKKKNPKIEADLVIENGVWNWDGTGGNHTITFLNEGHSYIISVNNIGAEETPEVQLEVKKSDKVILTENGIIKRN